MSAGWVAGVTRARAMQSRSLGATAYRHDLGSEAGLADAQRAVSATLLWHLRVLAGWQPRPGAAAVRLLASGFEIANVDDQARALSGAESSPPARRPYRLGALASAWPRLSLTGSSPPCCCISAAPAGWRRCGGCGRSWPEPGWPAPWRASHTGSSSARPAYCRCCG